MDIAKSISTNASQLLAVNTVSGIDGTTITGLFVLFNTRKCGLSTIRFGPNGQLNVKMRVRLIVSQTNSSTLSISISVNAVSIGIHSVQSILGIPLSSKLITSTKSATSCG